jgi:hypothetical protein
MSFVRYYIGTKAVFMKTTVFLILLIATGITSCHKPTMTRIIFKGDYLITGSTGGIAGLMAMSDYYIINDNQLRKEPRANLTKVPDDDALFSFTVAMPQSKYDSVKELLTNIPAELLDSTFVSIGKSFPDAGYRDVRVLTKDKYYVWHFEVDQSSSSAAVQQYVAKLNALFP